MHNKHTTTIFLQVLVHIWQLGTQQLLEYFHFNLGLGGGWDCTAETVLEHMHMA